MGCKRVCARTSKPTSKEWCFFVFIRCFPDVTVVFFYISNAFVKRSLIKRPYRRRKKNGNPKKQRRILKYIGVYDIILSTTYWRYDGV